MAKYIYRLSCLETMWPRFGKLNPKHFALVCIICLMLLAWLITMGITDYLFEKNYFKEFRYPLEVDIPKFVALLRSNRQPALQPVNPFKYDLALDCAQRCRDELGHPIDDIRLVFVVKSALGNFERRNAIRQTWGWDNRFSDVGIRRVFLLGVDPEGNRDLQKQILGESEKYADLVQGLFADSYFNNTIKTMMGFFWIVRHCPKTEYVMFVDDDYYVSAKNVLRYLRRPDRYPDYLQHAVMDFNPKALDRQALAAPLGLPDDDEEPERNSPLTKNHLFTGYRFFSHPLRMTNSKWHMTLEEYPFHKYPPYITAGAYLLSSEALHIMYFASLYTLPFRLDDVYLGILAKKTNIEPIHNPNFYYHKLAYSKSGYAYCIATHGYEDTEELTSVWNEQRIAGNA